MSCNTICSMKSHTQYKRQVVHDCQSCFYNTLLQPMSKYHSCSFSVKKCLISWNWKSPVSISNSGVQRLPVLHFMTDQCGNNRAGEWLEPSSRLYQWINKVHFKRWHANCFSFGYYFHLVFLYAFTNAVGLASYFRGPTAMGCSVELHFPRLWSEITGCHSKS